jgi:hypothetical protein
MHRSMTSLTSHSPWQRLAALAGVALVLWLSVLAVSPELHEWLHGDAHAAEHTGHDHAAPVGDADHACAVTLFAHGVEALLIVLLLVLARSLARSTGLRAADWLIAARPPYWLVPSHAPPLV